MIPKTKEKERQKKKKGRKDEMWFQQAVCHQHGRKEQCGTNNR